MITRSIDIAISLIGLIILGLMYPLLAFLLNSIPAARCSINAAGWA